MFKVTAYCATNNSKVVLDSFADMADAILSAEAAYLVGNFDGATVVDLDANRQVFSVGDNT